MTKYAILFVFVSLFCSLAQAQVVTVTGIGKTAFYIQTGPKDHEPDGYAFFAFIEGDELEPDYPEGPRSVKPPARPAHDLDFDEDAWYLDEFFPTLQELSSAFPEGSYELSAGGETLSLNLSGNQFPVIPMATVSAGEWVQGELQITESQAAAGVRIESNKSDANGFVSLEIEGVNNDYYFQDTDVEGFTSIGYDVPPGAFEPGGVYDVYLEFDRVVELISADAFDPGADGFALFNTDSTFRINVVPDPAPSADLVVSAIRQPNGLTSATVSWVSTEAKTWVLQFSTDLLEWTTIGDAFTSSIGNNTIPVAESPLEFRYFRLKTP